MIIEHLEKILGKIDGGYAEKDFSHAKVAYFKAAPEKGFTTYSTIGLSDHVLEINDAKSILMELTLTIEGEHHIEDASSVLISVCRYILSSKRSPLKGEVLKLESKIFRNSEMNSVYFTSPFTYDDEISEFISDDKHAIIVQLIPVYEQEFEYIRKNGWSLFENLLEDKDPDVTNINRPVII